MEIANAHAWWDRPGIHEIFDEFRKAGHQIFAVGGCVRNDQLGVPVKDVDFATSARPEHVMDLAAGRDWKTVPTGIRFGSVLIVLDGSPFEVTTFRRDMQTDGRHAVVEYGGSHEEDARRRDFTMNALYAGFDRRIVDPLNGIADLRSGRVRFIGEAAERIREDRLRMLRYFRMHAHYSADRSRFDESALEAVAAFADEVRNLSRERIGREFALLLEADDPSLCLEKMESTGLLGHILPGSWRVREANSLAELERKHSVKASALARLAVFRGGDSARRLRLSRADDRKLARIEKWASTAESVASLAHRLGKDEAVDILLARAAIANAPLAAGFEETAEAAANAEFPVSAKDFAPRLEGPRLGRELERLRKLWVDSGFAFSRKALLADSAKRSSTARPDS